MTHLLDIQISCKARVQGSKKDTKNNDIEKILETEAHM